MNFQTTKFLGGRSTYEPIRRCKNLSFYSKSQKKYLTYRAQIFRVMLCYVMSIFRTDIFLGQTSETKRFCMLVRKKL